MTEQQHHHPKVSEQVAALINPLDPGQHVVFINAMCMSIAEHAKLLILAGHEAQGRAIGLMVSTIGISVSALAQQVPADSSGYETYRAVCALLNGEATR